jgi:pimeloyl-ACP methyl ester carboxylesterase
MDAVGLDRAVIYGRSEGGQMACMFAAMYPELTALITWGTMARFVQAEGHP